MTTKSACLFPAFAMKYRNFNRQCFDGYQEHVARFLNRVSTVVPIDMRKFEAPGEVVLDDPLQNSLQEQYVCYIDGCAMATLLRRKGLRCNYAAGYSMGLFAALYYSSALSFEDGLRLLHHTCLYAHEAIQEGHYGMAAVVGLTPEELGKLIQRNCRQVEVADVCGPRVVIASGLREDLGRLLEASEVEGCLQARLLPVSLPFHSSLLQAAEDRIREFVRKIRVRPPQCPVISCVDQHMLRQEEDVRREAVRNVSHPIHWLKTMNRLLQLGVKVFAECGLSESLCNLARNVDGDFSIYHPRKFDRLFAQLS